MVGTSPEIKLMLVHYEKIPFLFTFQHLGAKYIPLIFSNSLPNARDEITEKWVCIRNLLYHSLSHP